MKLVSGLAAAFSVALLLVVFLVMVQSTGWLNGSSGTWDPVPSGKQLTEGQNLIFSTAVKNFGYGLMTKYMLPLQVSGFLLLAAMVGVIVLSKKEGNEVS